LPRGKELRKTRKARKWENNPLQVINYLKSTGKQLGLLVNFGHRPKIEYERFVNQPLSRVSRIS